MRCLFIFGNSPLAPNYSGGAARYLMSYRALHELGVELHVWRPLETAAKAEVYDFEQQDVERLADWRTTCAATWTDFVFQPTRQPGDKISRLVMAYQDPARFIYLGHCDVLAYELQAVAAACRPDFVWAEHLYMGVVVQQANLDIPWVYSHHDWLYRLAKLKYRRQGVLNDWRFWFTNHVRQRGEETVAQSATVVVTGSRTEADDLRKLGISSVFVIPTCYDMIPELPSNSSAVDDARIVHLGSTGTTANRLGLRAYLAKVHPVLSQRLAAVERQAPLWIIGDSEPRDENTRQLWHQLRDAGAIMTGMVPDLGTVLRPFDISIIPYEHNTGTRTKIPLLFSYAQVVVATHAAAAGTPELGNGENCVLLPSLNEFPETLLQLIQDRETRERIGRAARTTFQKQFTIRAQLPKYTEVLNVIGEEVK